MKLYMLTIYIIHEEYVEVMVGHHLQLNIKSDFTYTTIEFFIANVDDNLFIVTN
jgi:hypothetical protein